MRIIEATVRRCCRCIELHCGDIGGQRDGGMATTTTAVRPRHDAHALQCQQLCKGTLGDANYGAGVQSQILAVADLAMISLQTQCVGTYGCRIGTSYIGRCVLLGYRSIDEPATAMFG